MAQLKYWDGSAWQNVVVGAQGPQGATGPAGPGVASGGTTGQVLAKSSNSDYATEWVTVEVDPQNVNIVLSGQIFS